MYGLRRDDHRVVAIDPTSRGFGYAVLEGPAFLVDWGTRDFGRADSTRALMEVHALVRHYEPDAVVVEDVTDPVTRRRERARELIEAVAGVAAERRAAPARVARVEVQRVFRGADATTKHAIAHVIAGHFPELSPRLPPTRKAWMSEDARMSIFDAVAFALAFYFRAETPPPTHYAQQDQLHAQQQETHGARP
jgi:hypothetical protein